MAEAATVELTGSETGANTGTGNDSVAVKAADSGAKGQGAAPSKTGNENGNLSEPKYTQAELDAQISKVVERKSAELKKQFEHDQNVKSLEMQEQAAKTADELRRVQEEKKRLENEFEATKIRTIQDANIHRHLDDIKVPNELRPLFERAPDGKDYEEAIIARANKVMAAWNASFNEAMSKKLTNPSPDSSNKSTATNSGGRLRDIYKNPDGTPMYPGK